VLELGQNLDVGAPGRAIADGGKALRPRAAHARRRAGEAPARPRAVGAGPVDLAVMRAKLAKAR
jgi:hypothetical protein